VDAAGDDSAERQERRDLGRRRGVRRERLQLFLNELVGGGDGYLFLCGLALPLILWEGAADRLGWIAFLGGTAIAAVAIGARLHYLAGVVFRGVRVVATALEATRTGRFRVRWEYEGTSHEAALGRGSLPLKRARTATHVVLLVDPRHPGRAIITHSVHPGDA